MRYGETGINLEIDLSRGNIEKIQSDPRDTELYLGGLGTNAKMIWDRVPPEVEPFSPENLLIFSSGLLCGTPAIGCNRTIVSTISPQTRLKTFAVELDENGILTDADISTSAVAKILMRRNKKSS